MSNIRIHVHAFVCAHANKIYDPSNFSIFAIGYLHQMLAISIAHIRIQSNLLDIFMWNLCLICVPIIVFSICKRVMPQNSLDALTYLFSLNEEKL